MRFPGKRVRANIPVVHASDRTKFSVTLNGANYVVAHTFTDFGRIHELLVDVPVLASAATVIMLLHDKDYQGVNDRRWTTDFMVEDAVHDFHCFNCKGKVVMLDRMVHPGDTLQIKANAAATEVVTGIIYEVGA